LFVLSSSYILLWLIVIVYSKGMNETLLMLEVFFFLQQFLESNLIINNRNFK